MLKSLSIKNYTLIDDIEITFSPGFNIFIGETGAGKSVIVGALMLALGGRANSEQVAKNKDKAVVEAVFEFPQAHPLLTKLDDLGIDKMSNIIITRREIYARGNSRCFVNDTPVPVAQLKNIGEQLADFHGQHDSQLVLKPENHISFIDLYIDNEELKNKINIEYERQTALIAEYKSVLSQEKDLRLQSEAYAFELNEIHKIEPQPDEDTKLENELKILENSEILFEQVNEMLQTLYEGNNSVYDGLAAAENNLAKLESIDRDFSSWFDELKSASVTIREIAEFAQNYRDNIDFNQNRIEEIRLRLASLNGLKKKYGSYKEIFDRIEFLESKLALANNFDNETSKLLSQINDSKYKLGKITARLSKIRKKKSKEFEYSIVNILNELSLDNVIFNVVITNEKAENPPNESNTTCIIDDIEYVCGRDGIDSVEFYISTNKGEPPKPLTTVASGGELSRIMLAIKTLIADRYAIPLLIFDEIDTGISGRVAQQVGYAIKGLSRSHQIVAITHLAQIAAMGDKIITVNKNESHGRTTVSVSEENDETKKIEIAKLISGENVSESSLETVNELLDYRRKD
jgi:DNA repair protein RecN (Recombination protein N)